MGTRIGKIARLPRTVRDQLNARLYDGEPGSRLLEWLNGVPEVQTVLAAEFEGRPINPQNLSDWKLGGYRDWVAQQEALELAQRLAEDCEELQPAGRPPLTDTLAHWLAARYVAATRTLAGSQDTEQWSRLRELCADVVELRRGDHCAERLKLEREKLEFDHAQRRKSLEERFQEWAMDPDRREAICKGFMTRTEKIAAIRKAAFVDVDALEASGEVVLPK